MNRHPKPNRLHPGCVLALGVSLVLAHTGCVTRGYKLAPKSTPPPVPLNLSATPAQDTMAGKPAAEITLHAVIVFKGPGSWKREAYWDEYVLSIANRGPTALTVDSATLTDFQGAPTSPGAGPWKLEKQSRTYESRVRATAGNILKIGGGSVATTGAVFAVGAAMMGSLSGYAGAGLAIASVGIALPAYAAGTIFLNVSNKHRIEDQFSYRRLVLPATLAPGQTAQGSLFFRITPGPQRLALHCATLGTEPRDVVIDLTPLAGLHLQSATAAPPAAPLSSP